MGINESIILLMVVGLNMTHGSFGQSSGCTTALISLAPCLNYISATGTASPSSSCCSRLASVVQSQPQCLCSALNGGAAASLGVTINQTRALELPAACHLQTPSPTRCNDSGNGGGAPAMSPISSPNNEDEDTNNGNGGGASTISPISSPDNAPDDDDEDGEAPSDTNFPSAIVGSQNVPMTGAGIPSGGWTLINSPFHHLITLNILILIPFCYVN